MFLPLSTKSAPLIRPMGLTQGSDVENSTLQPRNRSGGSNPTKTNVLSTFLVRWSQRNSNTRWGCQVGYKHAMSLLSESPHYPLSLLFSIFGYVAMAWGSCGNVISSSVGIGPLHQSGSTSGQNQPTCCMRSRRSCQPRRACATGSSPSPSHPSFGPHDAGVASFSARGASPA